MFRLIIGSKQFSSWSLRPWLVLKMLDEPFEEQLVDLRQPDSQTVLQQLSPSGQVPVLLDRQLRIWDSLAICEYLAEVFPGARLWPEEPGERALARAICAEMHAGFAELRRELSIDFSRQFAPRDWPVAVVRDINRVVAIWDGLRERHHAAGPFLFGGFGIADAYYAPVVCRFKGYGVELSGWAKQYAETMYGLAPLQQWIADAYAEPLSSPLHKSL